MKSPAFPFLLLSATCGLLLAPAAQAGHQVEAAPDKSKIVDPTESTLPPGNITLGAKFSDHLQSGYIDSVTPFWDPGGVTLFLSTRSTLDDQAQYLSSYGLGARYLVPGHDVIIGANAFYDSIDSRRGNHFDELGLGFELLSRWFDARFNWYLPDGSIYEFDRYTETNHRTRSGPVFQDGNLFKQSFTDIRDRTVFRRYESALEGFNLEAGFLVPGVDKYFELRLLAGYYRYHAAFGKDFEGVKARAEARILPGVIADLEYWDDVALVGGHWVAGLRVTVPFSIGNLFTGKNPFEGASESFRPRQRDFRERLGEMVIRSHRVMTTDSDAQADTTTTTSHSVQTVGTVPAAPAAPAAPAPPPPPPPDE